MCNWFLFEVKATLKERCVVFGVDSTCTFTPDVARQSVYLKRNGNMTSVRPGRLIPNLSNTNNTSSTFHTDEAETLRSARSCESFSRTNSDFIHEHIVQLRNGCRVGQRWFSSPVYYTFLCRSCVFSIKEEKSVWIVIFFFKGQRQTHGLMIGIHKHGVYIQTGVKIRQLMYLVMTEY